MRSSSTRATATSVPDLSTFIRTAAPAATTWMARPKRFASPTAPTPATARRRSFRPRPRGRRHNWPPCSTRSSTWPVRGPVPTAPGSPAFTGTDPTSPRTRSAPIRRVRTQSRSGRVRAGAGSRHHQVGDVCRRASRGGRVLPGRQGRRLPGHLRTLQRVLARDGGGLRRRHAPRRSLLERDEQHRFDPQATRARRSAAAWRSSCSTIRR